MQQRQCKMCKALGQQEQMTMVRLARLALLNPWYPNDIKNKNDWVHKQCLASLGLYPFPNNGIDLNVIGEKIKNILQECVAVHSLRNNVYVEETDRSTPFLQSSVLEQFERMIPAVVASANDPEVCERCHRLRIRDRMETTPSHSDVDAKRAHRAWIIQHLAGCTDPMHPALMYLDDQLPLVSTNEPAGMTYFTEDLLTSPALQGRIQPQQLFSPNIKHTVVRDLRRLGVLHTAESCACLFLQRYAPVIRDHHGGLAMMFLDVWGAFENGARPLLALSLSLCLLEPRGCFVTFAATDRRANLQGRDAVESHASVEEDAQNCIRGAGLLEWRVPHPPSLPLKYRSMQVHAWIVEER